MGKRDRYFEKIEEYKQRFHGLSTETIQRRLNAHDAVLYPEARVALRQLLKEREDRNDRTQDTEAPDT